MYEGRLTSKPGLEHQRIVGVDGLDGAGATVAQASEALARLSGEVAALREWGESQATF